MSPASYRAAPPRGTRSKPSTGAEGVLPAAVGFETRLRRSSTTGGWRRGTEREAQRQPAFGRPAPQARLLLLERPEQLPRHHIVLVVEVEPQPRVQERREHLRRGMHPLPGDRVLGLHFGIRVVGRVIENEWRAREVLVAQFGQPLPRGRVVM